MLHAVVTRFNLRGNSVKLSCLLKIHGCCSLFLSRPNKYSSFLSVNTDCSNIIHSHVYISKGKGKVFPLQARLWPRRWVEVKLYFSMTAALEWGEWSAARPGRTLPPGKTRYPLYRRLGGPQGRSGRAENLAPPGFDPRTVQPVAQSHYRLSYPAHICTLVPA